MNLAAESFRAAHVREIEAQPQQFIELHDYPAAEDREGESSFTLRADGRIVACAGVVTTGFGSHVWALIARDAPMLVVHRAARRFLSLFQGRLAATTPVGFSAGCRWLEMLGFRKVGEAEVEGQSHLLYMRDAS